MTAHLIRLLILLWLIAGTVVPPPAGADPGRPTAVAGDRVAITFVSDRQDNGPSTWFDALNRPRSQERTVLVEPVGAARLWTSTLVYTAVSTTLRLSATFTTTGSFARCVVTVNDELRDQHTALRSGARVTCAS
ncbi:hypothetical protein GCM10010528_26190 [Gordonia defluvii]|uniref:MmpS family membrane protein n=1 Tax=Gordonia defluvii TaxID=283718 RepID=A0ABP6LJ43_9ACTN|nr:hypothetical protein [Gordonia sp. UBA5067]